MSLAQVSIQWLSSAVAVDIVPCDVFHMKTQMRINALGEHQQVLLVLGSIGRSPSALGLTALTSAVQPRLNKFPGLSCTVMDQKNRLNCSSSMPTWSTWPSISVRLLARLFTSVLTLGGQFTLRRCDSPLFNIGACRVQHCAVCCPP